MHDENGNWDVKIILVILLAAVIFGAVILITKAQGLEGVDLMPDGKGIEASTTIEVVREQTFEEKYSNFTLSSFRILFEDAEWEAKNEKKAVDNLASKYAKLYDSCRFSR